MEYGLPNFSLARAKSPSFKCFLIEVEEMGSSLDESELKRPTPFTEMPNAWPSDLSRSTFPDLLWPNLKSSPTKIVFALTDSTKISFMNFTAGVDALLSLNARTYT